MSKYTLLMEKLATDGTGQMTCFGHSMEPILKSGSTLTFEKRDKYEVGDIVFCKVKGRYIDAHKITKITSDGQYMIANNHGWENGWTRTIYGKAVKVTYKGETRELEAKPSEPNPDPYPQYRKAAEESRKVGRLYPVDGVFSVGMYDHDGNPRRR